MSSKSSPRVSSSSKSKKKKVKVSADSDRGAAPLCKRCKAQPAQWSKRTKGYIQLCKPCNDLKKKGNRASYHKRHEDEHKKASVEHQIAVSQEKLFKAQGDCGSMRERMAVLQKRYDSLQAAYEESQKSLAKAIDSANTGKPAKDLPTSVSVRNESIVVQRLQEITEILTDKRAAESGKELAILETLRAERKQYLDLFDHTIKVLEELVVKTSR